MSDNENSSGKADQTEGEQGAVALAWADKLAELGTGLEAAGYDVDQDGDVIVIATGAIASLAEKLEKTTSDFESARDRADKLQRKLDAADKAPRVRQGEQAKLRKVGPVEGQPDPRDLLAQIREAGEAELVFAGKGKELALAPRIVAGDVWIITAVGLKLNLPELIVEGPGPQPLEIDGYGLFLGGKQVAYSARHQMVQLGAGRRMNLKDDVIFAG